MQLVIHISGSHVEKGNETVRVSSVDDLDRISRIVARAVKDWVRHVPIRRSGSRLVLTVDAGWVERGTTKGE